MCVFRILTFGYICNAMIVSEGARKVSGQENGITSCKIWSMFQTERYIYICCLCQVWFVWWAQSVKYKCLKPNTKNSKRIHIVDWMGRNREKRQSEHLWMSARWQYMVYVINFRYLQKYYVAIGMPLRLDHIPYLSSHTLFAKWLTISLMPNWNGTASNQ